jgi:ATP-binding cassette subfamily B protein
VIQEGELGEKFYILVRGKISVTAMGANQLPVQIGYMEDGDYFGEIALLGQNRRTATVSTLGPSLMLALERKHFSNMVESNPKVRAAIEHTASIRMSDTTSKITHGVSTG